MKVIRCQGVHLLEVSSCKVHRIN